MVNGITRSLHVDINHNGYLLTAPKPVLDSGRVIPAEALLRETGQAEFEEGGYGFRGHYAIPQKIEGLKTQMEESGFLEKINKIWPPIFVERWNVPSVPEMHNKPLSCKYSHLMDCIELRREIGKKWCCNEVVAAIMCDMFSENPVDKLLTELYNELISKWHLTHFEADKICREGRQMALPAGKLNCEIRAGSDCVFWSYAKQGVVVLRGEYDKKVSFGRETFLLPPYANGGEFFSLSLQDQKTAILGPRKILQPYKERYGDQICYIESLSETQKEFLGITFQLLKEIYDQPLPDPILDQILETLPFFAHFYKLSARVNEGYSVLEHTYRVLNRFRLFKKAIEEKLPSCLSIEKFALFLALHDLCKGAPRNFGQTANERTIETISLYSEELGLTEDESSLFCAFLNHDSIGCYLLQAISAEKAAEQIRESAQKGRIAPLDFFTLMDLYHNCDAGSYPTIRNMAFIEGGFERVPEDSERMSKLLKLVTGLII